MGKSLSDLHLNDQPIQPPASTAPRPSEDDRDTDWYAFAREIDDLLAEGRVRYAEDTLTGIQETVERTKHVTEGQRRAVRNIAAAASEARRGGGRRRYEGFGGGRW